MIKIRKATLKDVPVLVMLLKELNEEHDKMVAKNPQLKKYILKKKQNKIVEVFSKKAFIKTIKSKEGILLLAEDDNKIVGYLEGAVRQPKTCIDKIASMWDIFVEKDYRGMGISNMLKEETFMIFRKKGAKYIELNLSIINTRAHSIYKKWGFSDIDRMMMKKI
ncbi:MAG: GNAT family N-acetyltransferase [Nanoarchaeota archaeon]